MEVDKALYRLYENTIECVSASRRTNQSRQNNTISSVVTGNERGVEQQQENQGRHDRLFVTSVNISSARGIRDDYVSFLIPRTLSNFQKTLKNAK